MPANSEKTYLSVAGYDWQLRLYDPYVKLVGRGRKKNAPRSGNYAASFRILDIGCGSGTLALLMKKLRRAVDIVGRDPDPKALARAKKKSGTRWDIDLASKAPFAKPKEIIPPTVATAGESTDL